MTQQKLTNDLALNLLHENTQNVNLRRHGYAVSIAMKALYRHLKESGKSDSTTVYLNEEEWGIVGLLHDADYEKTKDATSKHTLLLLDWIKSYEVSTHVIEAFQSHNNRDTHLRAPQTLLEWSLECCDELTGFIVACALVQPDKKLESVNVQSVKNKWGKKEFARAVDRKQIEQCEERLGISLDVFIEVILKDMQKNSVDLGL